MTGYLILVVTITENLDSNKRAYGTLFNDDIFLSTRCS